MSGEERREQIIYLLKNSKEPVSGASLAKKFDVSRQVIVQDIALIRAKNINIYSTHRGYVVDEVAEHTRTFKVIHEDNEVEAELNAIVDIGGKVLDVFVYHKIYGVLKAEMNIKSRRDVATYVEGLKSGKSSFLKNITSGYHYHTVVAESENILDEIQETLWEMGFLAKLKEYEPVDFLKKKEDN